MLKQNAKTVYYVQAAWSSFAFAVIFTINMVYQVEVAGLTPLQLVLVGTALEASAFLFEVPTGIVADLYSRRLSIIIGVFITGVAYLVQAVPTFFAIAFSSALWGLGYTFTSGAHQAWIADEVGAENVGPVFLRAGQFGRAGGLVGIPVSVALASVSLQLPIVVGGLLFLGLGALLIGVMPETGFAPTPKEERDTFRDMRRTLKGGLSLVRARPTLLDFALIGLFVGLYSEGYDRLWTAHLLENFTLPDFFGLDPVAWFGLIRISASLLGIGANELVHRRLDLNDERKTVRALQGLYAFMVATLFVFALSRSFPLALGVLLAFNVCRGLTFPIQETWINQFIDSKVRATVLSFYSQVDALGQTSGGPVIGAVGNAFGLRAAISLASVILLPVFPLYQRTLRRKQSDPLLIEP